MYPGPLLARAMTSLCNVPRPTSCSPTLSSCDSFFFYFLLFAVCFPTFDFGLSACSDTFDSACFDSACFDTFDFACFHTFASALVYRSFPSRMFSRMLKYSPQLFWLLEFCINLLSLEFCGCKIHPGRLSLCFVYRLLNHQNLPMICSSVFFYTGVSCWLGIIDTLHFAHSFYSY